VTTGAGKNGKAGKPVLFSNRKTGKAGISTFEILKNTSLIVFWSGLRKIFSIPLNNVLLILYFRLTTKLI